MSGHVLRLSNCFGYPLTADNDCWGLVLNEFIRDACKLGRITIRGDHFSRRDFLPIKELNRILISFFKIKSPIPQIINISTGTSLSLLEIAEKVSGLTNKITGNQIEIVKANNSRGKYKLKINNNSLHKMGIIPNDNLDEEIKLMLNFLK